MTDEEPRYEVLCLTLRCKVRYVQQGKVPTAGATSYELRIQALSPSLPLVLSLSVLRNSILETGKLGVKDGRVTLFTSRFLASRVLCLSNYLLGTWNFGNWRTHVVPHGCWLV